MIKRKSIKFTTCLPTQLKLSIAVLTLASCIFTMFDPFGLVNLGVLIPLLLLIEVIVLLLYLYMICCLMLSNTIIMIFANLYGVYMVFFYTIELRLGRKKYRTSNELRDNSQNLCHVYRLFQVPHINSSTVFGPYILIFNV